MRTRTRGVLSAVLVAVAVLTTVPAAEARKPKPVPTQAEVDAAQDRAARKAGDVAALQASLAVANARLRTAAEHAEHVAEAYNGARWRLEQAEKATADAKLAVADALAHVEEQRAGIAQLVTQSLQDATLSNVEAVIGADGPTGVMNRLAVVQSAGDSMQARFDQYTALNALARVAQEEAEEAEDEQRVLAREAAKLRDEAAQTANAAQSAAAAIAGQRRQLIEELAKAQKITVELATKRQQGLEEIAEQQAAVAAAADAKEKAKKARSEAVKARNEADSTQGELDDLGVEGGWDDPGLPVPKGTTDAAKSAIEFARAQLGEPYLWAAAGPDAWDCSGLTMMAWAKGGVSLPHFSAAQYDATKHITAANLRPGDLAFWGTSPNTIHHVALYIGNGQILHAPRTGTFVRIDPMYSWPPDYFGRP